MARARSDVGALTVVGACTGALALAVALANVATLARVEHTARVRDLYLLDRLRSDLDAVDFLLIAHLPRFVNAHFDLHAWPSLLGFTALAVVAHLIVAALATLIVAPLVVPVARRFAGAGERWPRGLPTGILAALSVPVVSHRLGLWTHAGDAVTGVASVGLAAAAWLLAGRLLRTHRSAARLVAACALVTLTGWALASVGSIAAVRMAARGVVHPAPPPAGTPNILLVSIDTLRPDHLTSYGYARATSPTIDTLAAAGARFTTVVSPTSWTLPAHVTLLTALPPEVHGVNYDGRRLDPSVVTLAEVLRAQGYATAGFVSGPYLDAGYGYARGFDLYDDYSAVRISRPAVHQAHTSPALLAQVGDWLTGWDTATPARPFFLFVHMWDVHYDFNPPPPYDTLFDPDYRGHVTGDDFVTGDQVHVGMDPRDLAHVIALYDGEIRYTDEYLGRIVDLLKKRHHLDDTIVVVTGDHGEEFFEHGQKGHHIALYDESIRVPLVVRYPARVPAGTVVDAQVRLLDVAPTILALANVPAPPSFGLDPSLTTYAGHDLTPLVAAGAPPSDVLRTLPAFSGLQPHGLSSLRYPEHKLITGPMFTPREQLYDLKADPGEHVDIDGKDPARASELRTQLFYWSQTTQGIAKQTTAAPMSAEHQDALRALGYIK